MKIRECFFIIFIIIALTQLSYGQESNSQTTPMQSNAAGFKFGVGGGVGGFSYDNSNVSYNAAFNIGAKLKLNIPHVAFTPVAFLNYYFLTGKFSGNPINTTVPINSDINQKILTLGAGAEFKFVPDAQVSPYLAVDIDFNHIGELSFDQQPLNFTNPGAISRTGFDAGGGIMFIIPYAFTIDASLKYAVLNVLGKDSGENSINSWNLNISILF
jgi:hypothetical protein